ncbi:hypothetical protein [Pseudoalteromonas xiamenensis]|uniref:Uncharacterized protein n=1 Tax=Pseudoalteromonas xiamenensis TaxID=882626 RepID=A0A975HKT1_9GAMM|nr:hypothetical protein [Pseudoalteromonas xiamenensis]QTH71363.1 hypothetical protein J5O05_16520 [Pseudoalteromonas xiamenensis]
MSKLDKTEVLSAFEAAYEAKNGKKPDIVAKSGWFSVDGGKNIRLAEVAALTEELTSGSAPAAEKKAAPAKKTKTTKKAEAKSAKKGSFTVIKANEDGDKAEELWIAILARKDHDCRLPRGVV